ncbi:hypothetical protein M0805_002931 [Coniferiporia weirii]|nr:hypothetical protein M0805_002931 [Coniferiporia weirii]
MNKMPEEATFQRKSAADSGKLVWACVAILYIERGAVDSMFAYFLLTGPTSLMFSRKQLLTEYKGSQWTSKYFLELHAPHMSSPQFANPSATSAPSDATTHFEEPPRYDESQSLPDANSRQMDTENNNFEGVERGGLNLTGRSAESIQAQDGSISPSIQPGGIDGQGSSRYFGEDTPNKVSGYQSDEIFPENRFGELGRADTYAADRPHMSDRIKGTAEQIVGKLTFNKDLHDKGVSRKASHHHYYTVRWYLTVIRCRVCLRMGR